MKKCIIFTLLSVCLLGFGSRADAQSNADCFKMQTTKSVRNIPVERTFNNSRGTSELKLFDGIDTVYGLSVTMDINCQSDDYLVRVLLEDADGRMHLVAESYREIAPTERSVQLTDYCEETALLSGVRPVSLHVIARGAEVSLHTVGLSTAGTRDMQIRSERFQKQVADLRQQQVQAKVDQINAYNKEHRKLWFAGSTSVSLMDFDTKLLMMNATSETNFGGFEYYAGGIFEIGDATKVNSKEGIPERKSPASVTSVNPTISVMSFDWRNRHGHNWMTPVRDQRPTPYCVAFSISGCMESMRNLYFYTPEDTTHLSVQQLACCSFISEKPDSLQGIHYYQAFPYCINNGLMLNSDYPFVNNNSEPQICHSDEKTPSDVVKITNYQSVSTNESSAKSALMQNGPLVASLGIDYNSGGHSMILTGFGIVSEGLNYIDFPNNLWDPIADFHGIIESGDLRIGSTFWTYKNSWGPNWGVNGYCHIIFNDNPHIYNLYSITTPITTLLLTENDRLCTDNDGDGYYFWGVGSRPSSVPSWAANYMDMDDTDPDIGGLLSYNSFEDINPDHSDTVYVNSTNYTTVGPYSHNHIVVNSGGSFLVDRDYNFCNGAKLVIKSGGELIIRNGALLHNGNIDIRPGGKMSILEGGVLRLMQGKTFEAPIGAIIEIENGVIEPFF